MMKWSLIVLVGLVLVGLALWGLMRRSAVTAVISPDLRLNGVGENVDTIAFWADETPEETLMFVTAKGNSLVEVWPFPFDQEAAPLRHESFGSSQVNGVAVDQAKGKLYVSVAAPANVVSAFNLPSLTFEQVLLHVPLGNEPGIDLYQLNHGQRWVYTTADNEEMVYIQDADTGDTISAFAIGREMETIQADEFHGVVYIPDENGRLGIYAYTPELEPFTKNGRSRFGTTAFQADAEGILIYNCIANGRDTGRGFIVVSDQRKPTTDFEFFDRVSWEHVGTLHLEGVGNTDGIASLQASLPGYPLGLFAAIDDDTETAVVGWDKVLAGMGIGCEETAVSILPSPN
jgi:hypothetical protein